MPSLGNMVQARAIASRLITFSDYVVHGIILLSGNRFLGQMLFVVRNRRHHKSPTYESKLRNLCNLSAFLVYIVHAAPLCALQPKLKMKMQLKSQSWNFHRAVQCASKILVPQKKDHHESSARISFEAACQRNWHHRPGLRISNNQERYALNLVT